MKTSNKLLLIAFVLLLASLSTYNYALRAEYLTGNYKNPYKNFIPKDFKDFDVVELNAGTQINVTIKKGESKVWLDKRSNNQVKITQQGRKLVINVAYAGKDQHWNNSVIITCPNLVAIQARSIYLLDGKQKTDNKPMNDDYYHDVVLKGFKQDSLTIDQDNATSVTLFDNQIGLLNVNTGKTANSTPQLILEKGNVIKSGNFNIGQKTHLVINNVYIPQLSYHFSDSAKITLSGIALRSLNKQ